MLQSNPTTTATRKRPTFAERRNGAEENRRIARAQHAAALERVRKLRPLLATGASLWRSASSRSSIMRVVVDDSGRRRRKVTKDQPVLHLDKYNPQFDALCVTTHGPARIRPLGSHYVVLNDKQLARLSLSMLAAIADVTHEHFRRYDTTNGAGTSLA